jgi:hypothetical protein
MNQAKKLNGLNFPIYSEDWQIKAEYRSMMILEPVDDPKMGAGLKISYRAKESKRHWASFAVKLDGTIFPTEDYIRDLVNHAAKMRLIRYGTPTPMKRKPKRKVK